MSTIFEMKHWKAVENDYQLLDYLGKGTSGTVRRAVHKETNQEVAIKRIQVEKSEHYRIKKLIWEIKIMKGLAGMERAKFHFV